MGKNKQAPPNSSSGPLSYKPTPSSNGKIPIELPVFLNKTTAAYNMMGLSPETQQNMKTTSSGFRVALSLIQKDFYKSGAYTMVKKTSYCFLRRKGLQNLVRLGMVEVTNQSRSWVPAEVFKSTAEIYPEGKNYTMIRLEHVAGTDGSSTQSTRTVASSNPEEPGQTEPEVSEPEMPVGSEVEEHMVERMEEKIESEKESVAGTEGEDDHGNEGDIQNKGESEYDSDDSVEVLDQAPDVSQGKGKGRGPLRPPESDEGGSEDVDMKDESATPEPALSCNLQNYLSLFVRIFDLTRDSASGALTFGCLHDREFFDKISEMPNNEKDYKKITEALLHCRFIDRIPTYGHMAEWRAAGERWMAFREEERAALMHLPWPRNGLVGFNQLLAMYGSNK